MLLVLTKDNVTIGIEWRFGPDWPGQRCGAKTRQDTACQCPANKNNGRCRFHGGASTGAKTEEGLARISAANLRHGKFTKDKLEKHWRDRLRFMYCQRKPISFAVIVLAVVTPAFAGSLDQYKADCAEIGFVLGTEKFGDWLLE